jgi:hypothetical protein
MEENLTLHWIGFSGGLFFGEHSNLCKGNYKFEWTSNLMLKIKQIF